MYVFHAAHAKQAVRCRKVPCFKRGRFDCEVDVTGWQLKGFEFSRLTGLGILGAEGNKCRVAVLNFALRLSMSWTISVRGFSTYHIVIRSVPLLLLAVFR